MWNSTWVLNTRIPRLVNQEHFKITKEVIIYPLAMLCITHTVLYGTFTWWKVGLMIIKAMFWFHRSWIIKNKIQVK